MINKMAQLVRISHATDTEFDTRHPLPHLSPPTQCKICGRERNLVGDHDHVTGTYRGKLCNACNIGLGMFQDDPQVLERALAYLKYWKLKDLFE